MHVFPSEENPIAATVLTMVTRTFLTPVNRWIGSLLNAENSPMSRTPWAAPK